MMTGFERYGEETRVWGDGAYQGQTEAIREVAPRARDCTKSKVRSRVEHVFGVMELKFGFVKVCYRGLAKNANRLFATVCWSTCLRCARNCCARRRHSEAEAPTEGSVAFSCSAGFVNA